MDIEQKIEHSPGDMLVWALMIVIMIGVTDFFTHHSPPEDIYVQCDQKFTNTNVELFANQGERLRFLGLVSRDKVWVENSRGVRDIISFHEGTLNIVSEHTVNDLKEYWRDTIGGYYFTSFEHVRAYSIGRQLSEIDGHWRPATRIYKPAGAGGGWKAVFTKIAALDEQGEMHTVIMTFDSEGRCTDVEAGGRVENHNKSWLTKMPYATTIAGWDWLMWNVQDNPYINMYNHWRWYWRLPFRCAWFLFTYFIWAILPLFIPLFLVMGSLCFDFMRHWPTSIVSILSIAATVVVGYPWVVAMLCWGYVGFIYFCLAALYILIAAYSGYIVYRADGSISAVRCDKCGRANSYKLVRSENVQKIKLYVKEYEKINRTVYRDKDSEKTTVYTVECYIHNTYDNTRKYRITTYREYAIVEYKDWSVEYDVTKSDNTYRCKCGAERFIRAEETRVPTGKRTFLGKSKHRFDIEGEKQDGELPKDEPGIRYDIVRRYEE